MQLRRSLLTCSVLAVSAAAGTSVCLAFEPAEFTPNVVDQAEALSLRQVEELNRSIQFVRDKADIWPAVYLVTTLGDEPIENAAELTFRRWELGAKGRDNGLLLMFALEDREARIEVGYGLEGEITDLHAKRVLDEVILPYFKSGDYAAGIQEGLSALGYIKTRDAVFLESSPELRSRSEALLRGGELAPDAGMSSEDLERGFGYWLWWAALVLGLPFATRLLKILGTGSVPGGRNPIGYLLGWDSSALIRGFLLINPGIFIVFLPAFLGPEISELMNSAEVGLALERGAVWLGFLFAAPALIRVPCYVIGRRSTNPNPVYRKSAGALLLYLADVDSAFSIIKKIILIVVPGMFYAVVGLILDSGNAGFVVGLLIGLVFGFSYVRQEWVEQGAPLLSEKHWRRQSALARLRRIQTRVVGTRQVFGRSYTYHRPSSSSSSSSRSGGFSSSSGGGRSGGGGASSRW